MKEKTKVYQCDEQTAANMQFIIDRGYKEKYDHYGVYCIKVDDKIVYVGKSRNMLRRIAQHMTAIDGDDKKNMYIVLRQLQNSHSISFDVLEQTKENDDDEMGFAEARAINKYMPCLNIQIPKLYNYHKYINRKSAQYITVEEIEKILGNGD